MIKNKTTFSCISAASRYVVPDLNADPLLYPVQKSVKEHNSIASYVALVMTKYGHRYVKVNVFSLWGQNHAIVVQFLCFWYHSY